MLNMGRTNKDDMLAREGAESCAVAVQGLSNFAKSKHPVYLYSYFRGLHGLLGINPC
jgi:hypothetical protein